MRPLICRSLLGASVACTSLFAGAAGATTIAQNSAFNVTRPGATDTLRIVAYGDSIYAGYTSATMIARRAGPHVSAEYGAALWGQNIEVRRRAQSGALASGIYNRIISATDRAFMQTPNTRMVTFVMGGNDYLQARSAFVGQSGTCNYAGLNTALANVQNFTGLAMQYINANAHANAKLKVVGNLYYPGFDADNVPTACSDPGTGQPINRRAKFLPLIAESNWRTCKLAEQYGWECADNFAEFMAADFDSNDDGLVDSDAIRYRPGESMEDYIHRITVQYVDTLTDSNFKEISAAATADYLLSDNTHATYIGPTAGSLFTTPSGNVAVWWPTPGAYPDSKNPSWNLNGSDRMGFELARPYDLNVRATPAKATILACERYEGSVSFNDKVFFGPWHAWVDYGNGAGTDTQLSEMSLALSNQYTAAGEYPVEVIIEGAYGTLWTDGATVTVRTAANAVQDLLDQLDALWATGTLKLGWWQSPRQSLIMALDKLGHGQVNPAQSMIGDFINKIATLPYPPATKQAMTEYATRAFVASACNPGPRGEPPYGRSKPNPNQVKALQPDLPEELWDEIED
jgi:lysophospholipase L1-like esterase